MQKIYSSKAFYSFIEGLFLLYRLGYWLYNKIKPWMNKVSTCRKALLCSHINCVSSDSFIHFLFPFCIACQVYILLTISSSDSLPPYLSSMYKHCLPSCYFINFFFLISFSIRLFFFLLIRLFFSSLHHITCQVAILSTYSVKSQLRIISS